MNAPIEPHRFTLEPFEARRFANLCGQFDEHLRLIEQRLALEIRNRGNQFELVGPTDAAKSAENLLRRLYRETKTTELSPDMVHLYLQESGLEELANPSAHQGVALRTKKGMIRPRGANQQRYVKAILDNDINFGIGPAGTGKTYLAVAAAVDALEREQIRRILLVRPAVEAGEKLGFLPGDLAQKIDRSPCSTSASRQFDALQGRRRGAAGARSSFGTVSPRAVQLGSVCSSTPSTSVPPHRRWPGC
ncbi:hypothetical protein SSTU70S_07011 [Stutzerimonas stutzeri]